MRIRFFTYALLAEVEAHTASWARPQPLEAELLLRRAPEPTTGSDILRRANLPKTVCAYENGNSAYPVACTGGGYCGYNTNYSWWGCCDGAILSASQWLLSGCPILTSCVQYNNIAQCGSACLSNIMILKCTNAGFPDCVTSTLTDDSLTEFNCATASGHLNFAENPQSSSLSQRPTSGAANPLYNPSSLSNPTPTTTTPTTITVIPTSPANPLYNPSSLSITETTTLVITATTTKAAGSSAQRVSSAFAAPATLAIVIFTATLVFFLVV